MLTALAIEGLSSALEVSRKDIRTLYERLEARLSHLGNELNRRVGAALATRGDASERASAIKGIAASVLDKESLKLVLGIVGTLYGAQLAGTGLMVSGSVVIAGLGAAVPAGVAVIVGVLLMVLCGRYCWTTMNKLFDEARVAFD